MKIEDFDVVTPNRKIQFTRQEVCSIMAVIKTVDFKNRDELFEEVSNLVKTKISNTFMEWEQGVFE